MRHLFIFRGGLGDGICFLSELERYHAVHSEAELHIETDYPDLMRKFPFVTGAYPIGKVDRRAFDKVTNMSQPDYISSEQMHTMTLQESYALQLGLPKGDRYRVIQMPATGWEQLRVRYKLLGKPLVVAFPHSRWASRNWEDCKWSELLARVKERVDVQTVAVSPFRRIDADIFLGKIPLDDIAGLIKHAALYLGVDSFGAHVASSFGVKAVVLHGTSRPSLRFPDYMTYHRGEGCLFCLESSGVRGSAECRWNCPAGHHDCMRLISVEDVLLRIQEVVGWEMGVVRVPVSVSLLNWKRPGNIPVIIEALRKQTIPCRILLWDNSGSAEKYAGMVDRYVKPGRNVMCWPKYEMLRDERSEFCCSLDDDILPLDPSIFEKCIDALRDKDCLVGPCGMRGVEGKDYEHAEHVMFPDHDEAVDVVKGRFVMFRRSALRGFGAWMVDNPFLNGREEDVLLSAYTAQSRCGKHLVLGSLSDSFQELPVGAESLNVQSGHYERRDKAFRTLFRGPGKDSPLTNSAVVVMAGRNCESYATECIKSVLAQDYKDLGVIAIDDASSDGTLRIVGGMLEGRGNTVIIANESRRPKIQSWREAVSKYCANPMTVLFWLDLDDRLMEPNAVSSMMRLHGEHDVVWSQYWDEQFGRVGCCGKLDGPPRGISWRSSHFKSFKKWLFDRVEDADLQDEKGEWFEAAVDLAVMFPMMEMVGRERCFFFDRVLYWYSANPRSLHRIGMLEEQKRIEAVLRKRQSKTLLSSRVEVSQNVEFPLVVAVDCSDKTDIDGTLESLYLQSAVCFQVALIGGGVAVSEDERRRFLFVIECFQKWEDFLPVSARTGRVILTRAGTVLGAGCVPEHAAGGQDVLLGLEFGSEIEGSLVKWFWSNPYGCVKAAWEKRSVWGNYPYACMDDPAYNLSLALGERNVSMPGGSVSLMPDMSRGAILKAASGLKVRWAKGAVSFYRAAFSLV